MIVNVECAGAFNDLQGYLAKLAGGFKATMTAVGKLDQLQQDLCR